MYCTVCFQFALKKVVEEETEELPRFCLLIKKLFKEKRQYTVRENTTHVEISAPHDKCAALKHIVCKDTTGSM